MIPNSHNNDSLSLFHLTTDSQSFELANNLNKGQSQEDTLGLIQNEQQRSICKEQENMGIRGERSDFSTTRTTAADHKLKSISRHV